MPIFERPPLDTLAPAKDTSSKDSAQKEKPADVTSKYRVSH